MKQEFFFDSVDGEHKIHAAEWDPEGEPVAVLQIIHGMTEHTGRYDDYAVFMAEQGFLVVGEDHLGHGDSVNSPDDRGFFREKNGNKCLLEDIHTLREMTQKKYPDLPYFILGHSMGSFLARQYAARHGEGLSGAVFMGTGGQPDAVLDSGMALCRLIAAFRGWRHRSLIVAGMSTGSYNKRFAGGDTSADWLSKNLENKLAFINDPKCQFIFTVNGYYNMFYSIKDCQSSKTIAKIRKDLPILLVSGEEDPVGDFGKGVRKAYELYKRAGIEDLSIKLYEGDRHEILNELDRDKVNEDLLVWFRDRM